MQTLTYFPSKLITLLMLGLTVSSIAPKAVAAPTSKASFPDIQNHWARPFIEPLAARNILVGYLDNTFQPNQPVQRDEFAAVIRQAFNQQPVREITRGSIYKDIPSDYWAAPAIKEAYETGAMTGYPGGFFRPNQNISRVEALVALQKQLNGTGTNPVASVSQTTPNPDAQANKQPVNQTQARQRGWFLPLAMTTLMQPIVRASGNTSRTPQKRRLMPLAMTTLMQPVVNPPVSSLARKPDTSMSDSPSPVASNSSTTSTLPASFVVSNVYDDAQKIPYYAVGNIADATNANIIVNHPNPKILNPNQSATRGDIAAFIYQTLVTQGKIEPLSTDVQASKYIVNGDNSSESNSQVVQLGN